MISGRRRSKVVSISFSIWRNILESWTPGGHGDPSALDMSLTLKTSVPATTPAPHVNTVLLCLVSTILAPHYLLLFALLLFFLSVQVHQ